MRFQVYAADFVSTESGTGIVHTAPAYGVDDLAFGQANGLPVVHGVGLDGHFVADVEPVAGMFFKDADKPLIRILKDRGLMFRSERYHAQLSVRLAHRRSDSLLREERLVHPHLEVPRAHGRAQQDDQVGARAYPRRALRQLAGEQCRLGAVPRAILGNTAAGMD